MNVAPTKVSVVNIGESANPVEEPVDSTSALLETIIPMVLPVVRRAVSKSLIESGSILRDEEPLDTYDERSPDDDLPIGPIRVQIESIAMMDTQTVIRDMKRAPHFKWPEKDNVEELMKNKPHVGRQMIVFDFVGFDIVIPLGRGIEYTFPAQFLGFKTNIEIGCGGQIKEASVQLRVPNMRVWFINKTRKLYVAFMDRPQFIPNIHVNADRGKGDFFNLEFMEEGELDDVAESILAGYGPDFKQKTTQNKNAKNKKNWVGAAIGKQISNLIEMSSGSGGKKSALEIDLSATIQASIDAAFGKPRPVEVIKGDIARLEKELELSMKQKEVRQDDSININDQMV